MCYKNAVSERYNYLYNTEYTLELNGRDSDRARETAERHAQHKAILITFDEMYNRYQNEVNAASIWNAIYTAHMIRKAGHFSTDDLNEDIIDMVVSGSQSWKKCSGHAFEHYIVSKTEERLAHYNIRFVLQKDLNNMLNNGQISNEEADRIQTIVHSDNFDIFQL